MGLAIALLCFAAILLCGIFKKFTQRNDISEAAKDVSIDAPTHDPTLSKGSVDPDADLSQVTDSSSSEPSTPTSFDQENSFDDGSPTKGEMTTVEII